MSKNIYDESSSRQHNVPHFVIDFLVLEDLQSPNLVENLWLVKADQVVDYNVWSPNVLKNNEIN